MSNLKRFEIISLILATALVTVSCGSTPAADPASTTTSASTSTGTTVTSTSTSTTTTTTTNENGSGLPPVQASFTVTGAAGSTPTYSLSVNTDNVLVVQVTAGQATDVIPGSNFSASYGCISYKITVGSDSVVTNTLSPTGNDYNCPGAPASQTIDFSSQMVSGHGATTITVSAAGYDWYWLECESDPYDFDVYYSYQCADTTYGTASYPVFKNHGVTGSLSVEVNGTSL